MNTLATMLPPEILERIADYVEEAADADGDPLKSFALVHSSWTLPAQRRLFREVCPSHTDKDGRGIITHCFFTLWPRLLRLLERSPRIRLLIHTLHVYLCSDCDTVTLSKIFPNVTTLVDYIGHGGKSAPDYRLISSLPTLQSLRFEVVGETSVPEPSICLDGLQALKLVDFRVNGAHRQNVFLRLLDRTVTADNPGSLHTIVLKYPIPTEICAFKEFLIKYKTITQLSLDVQGWFDRPAHDEFRLTMRKLSTSYP
jgi:hypothetical protein